MSKMFLTLFDDLAFFALRDEVSKIVLTTFLKTRRGVSIEGGGLRNLLRKKMGS